MNHKHRVQRLRDLAFKLFIVVACVVLSLMILSMFNDAHAAYIPPTCNASDAPVYSQYLPDSTDVDMLAKTGWGEARGLPDTEVAAVYWNILNRVDSPLYPDTIAEVITQTHQYAGYKPSYPATDRLRNLAVDVLGRWMAEKSGQADVGRVLPKEYLNFTGRNGHNVFKKMGGTVWRWTMPSPYEN